MWETLVRFLVGKICWRRDRLPTPVFLGFPCGSAGKESARNVGDLGSIPGLGRSLGEGEGYSLQWSGLENSMDCIVHGVTKSRTRLSSFHFHFSTLIWIMWSLWMSGVWILRKPTAGSRSGWGPSSLPTSAEPGSFCLFLALDGAQWQH